jgi:hypothetical protein
MTELWVMFCIMCFVALVFAYLWRNACIERDAYKRTLIKRAEEIAVYYSVLTWAGVDADDYLKKYQEWKKAKNTSPETGKS